MFKFLVTTGREEDMGGVCEVVKVNLPFIDSRTFSGEVSGKISQFCHISDQ